MALRQAGLLRAELHERFSSPLYPFAFVLLAVAFIGQAQTTRQNRVQAIVAAFLLSAGCRLAGLAGTNLVAVRPAAIGLVYAVPIAAIIGGLLMAQRGMSPRRQTRFGATLNTINDVVLERVAALTRRRPPDDRQRRGAVS